MSICARREHLLEEIAEPIRDQNDQALAVKADMTKWEEANNFIQATVDK